MSSIIENARNDAHHLAALQGNTRGRLDDEVDLLIWAEAHKFSEDVARWASKVGATYGWVLRQQDDVDAAYERVSRLVWSAAE